MKFRRSVSDFVVSLVSLSLNLSFLFPAELAKAMENAVPCIVELLKDTNSWVRRSAVTALGKLSEQRK